MPNPGMYRGDRRRKEDQRKAKQEAKKVRRAEVGALEIVEFVWFSPSKGRTLTTPNKAAPMVDGIDDWMLLSEPPAES